MEVDTDEMAESLDLASQAVGGGKAPRVVNEFEGVVYQSVEEVEEKQTEEERPKSTTPQSEARESDKETEEKKAELQPKEVEVQPEEPEPIVPSMSKPKALKRRLVLKNDPKAEGQKPKRVSKRCSGRWISSKAGANTVVDAVEDTPTATEMVSPTPNDQKEETDEMNEGLELASKSLGRDAPIDKDTIISMVIKPNAQKESSTLAEEKPKEGEDEDRYL